MLLVFPKNEQDNLTPLQLKILKGKKKLRKNFILQILNQSKSKKYFDFHE